MKLKVISFILIQAFLMLDFLPIRQAGAWAGGVKVLNSMFCSEVGTLAPAVNLNSNQVQNFFLRLTTEQEKSTEKEKHDTGPEITTERNWAMWLHERFVRRFNRIRKILRYILRGEDAVQKVFIASTMIAENLLVDIYLTNLIFKVAIFTACIVSGNFILIFIVAPLSMLFIGGIVRLTSYMIFKIIWPQKLKLTKNGLIINFIPWGLGNFAPLLFLKNGRKPQDLWMANEIRKLAKLIEKSVKRHTYASVEDINTIEKYSIEVAEAVWEYQSSLYDYDFRKFKIRGTKGYSEERIINIISRESIEKLPRFFKLQKSIFGKLGISFPGYRKGTRPILLFGEHKRLQQIKEFLKKSDLSKGCLGRLYQFDISEFTAQMKKMYENQELFLSTITKFISPMFPFPVPELENSTLDGSESNKNELPKNSENYKNSPSNEIGRSNQSQSEKFVIKVLNEWVKMQEVQDVGNAVFAFGSARFKPGHQFYQEAVAFGRRAVINQFAIITGGGPGIMDAANSGAFKIRELISMIKSEAGIIRITKAIKTIGLKELKKVISSVSICNIIALFESIDKIQSVGLNIKVPFEKRDSKYHHISLDFKFFFWRKLKFILHSRWGGAAFPGGFGTLDEIFEVLAFNRRNPDNIRPLVLINKEFYGGLVKFLEKWDKRGYLVIPDASEFALRNNEKEGFEYLASHVPSLESHKEEIHIGTYVRDLFRALRLTERVKPAVTIIGGKKISLENEFLKIASLLTNFLISENISVFNRGREGVASGISEAFEKMDKYSTLGQGFLINIHEGVPKDRRTSAHLTISLTYNSSLKTVLVRNSKYGFIFFPGGVDTLDMLFELLCLIQTKKIDKIPVVLVGKEFWGELFRWIEEVMVPAGTIDREDLELVKIVDSAEEARDVIVEYAKGIEQKTDVNKELNNKETVQVCPVSVAEYDLHSLTLPIEQAI